MRKIRAEIRYVPDTVLKLIRTFCTTYYPDRKLTNAEVVSIAIAKLTGKYEPQGDGTYVYTPQYEVCPDCSGLIDRITFNNPPPDDEAHADEWKAIKRQHVTKCTWLIMAQAGKFSKTPVKDYIEKIEKKEKPNVIEMRYENDDLITEDQTEVQVKDIKTEIPSQTKPLITKKPSLDNVSFEGEQTEKYIDDFGGVKTRVITIQKKKIVDDSNKSTGAKDTDNVSVTMEIGDSMGQSRNAEFNERMGDRKSVQGKVTEKNLDDKTMVIKTDVEGQPPDILLDKKTGDVVEKDIELSKPLRVAKARVSNKIGSIKSLDEHDFE